MKSLLLICFTLLIWPGEYNREERIQYVMVILLIISTITLILQIIPTISGNLRKKKKYREEISAITGKKNKIRTTYTPTTEDRQLVERAHQKIVEERLYCNPELTLDLLAGQLQVTRNTLSRAINNITGKNFKKYINEYRIKEAIRLLEKPENQNITLEAIIEMAGFNSRTPFYETFKSVTGYTPTEYLRKNKKKNPEKEYSI